MPKTGTPMTVHRIPKKHKNRLSRAQETYKKMKDIWRNTATNHTINNDHMKFPDSNKR